LGHGKIKECGKVKVTEAERTREPKESIKGAARPLMTRRMTQRGNSLTWPLLIGAIGGDRRDRTESVAANRRGTRVTTREEEEPRRRGSV